MGDELNVSPEALKEKASKIGTKVSEIENVLNEVSQCVGRVPDAFQGKASTEFQDKYNTLTKSYEKFSGKMQEYVAFLNKTADSYIKMDEQIANIANQGL